MDIYMAGSTFKELNEWLQQKGYNKLLSQENDRKEIAAWSSFKRSDSNAKSKLFIDSGAFTAHTKGIDIDVDEYIDYLNSLEDALTVYAQVDKIPGVFGMPKTDEEKAEAPKLSWQNYLYMAPKLKNKDKLIPIFHQGEDFMWLINMLEYTDEFGKHIPYIGISPANDVSVKDKKAWLYKVYDIIARSPNPNVKTHAFGMTSLKVLEQFPFTSADSTSWIMTAVNGSIFTEYGTVLVSNVDQSWNNPKHFRFMDIGQQVHIEEYVKSRGFTMEGLAEDYKQREYFNITYMNDWANNYVYKGGDCKRGGLINIYARYKAKLEEYKKSNLI